MMHGQKNIHLNKSCLIILPISFRNIAFSLESVLDRT